MIMNMVKKFFDRYVPPLRPVTSRWSLELPESPSALHEEITKQVRTYLHVVTQLGTLGEV